MHEKKDLYAAFLLLAVTFIFYFRFQGISQDADNLLQLFPLFTLYRFPYISSWENFTSSGSPLVYNIQNAAVYPLRWLFYFLPETFAYNLFTFLHYFLAFILTFTGLRVLKYSVPASLGGALLFGLSGGIQGKFINPLIFFAMVYLPLLIALTVSAFQRKTFSYSLLSVPVIMGLIFNIGNVHTSLYATITVVVIFLFFLACNYKDNCTRHLTKFMFTGFFTFLLALPVLIALVRMVPYTLRTTVAPGEIFDRQLSLSEVPFSLLGGISTPENLDKTIFTGLAGAWTLFWGLKHFRTLSLYYILFSAGFLLALGEYGLYWFFQFIPVLNMIINPSRALMISIAALPFIFAAWIDSLPHLHSVHMKVCFRKILIFTLPALALFIGGTGFYLAKDIVFPPISIQHLALLPPDAFLLISAGINLMIITCTIFSQRKYIMYLLIGLLLIFNGWSFTFRYDYREISWSQLQAPPHIQYLQNQMSEISEYRVAGFNYTQIYGKDAYDRRIFHFGSPNMMQWYQLEGIQGLNPLLNKRYAQFFEVFQCRKDTRVNHELLLLNSVHPLMMNMLGVRYIIGNPHKTSLAADVTIIPSGSEEILFESDSSQNLHGIGLITAIDSPLHLKRRDAAANLIVETTEDTIVFPIRYLEETFGFWDVEKYEHLHASADKMPVVNKWPHHNPESPWMGNYYSFFPFESLSEVKRISIRNVLRSGNFISYRVTGKKEQLFYFNKHHEYEGIFKNTSAYPRFYAPDKVVWYSDLHNLRKWIEEYGLDIPHDNVRIAFLQEDLRPLYNEFPPSGSIEISDTSPGYYKLVSDFQNDTFIATSIPYFPDWTLTINGDRVPLKMVNTAFLGFEVPSGTAHISLRFRPLPWFFSTAAAFASLLLLTGIAIILKKSKKPEQS